MRIITGERRGHKIESPRDERTRPTSDLVRESIFNILRDSIVDKTIYDLFAGTGALGLEALSRGASRAVFVESNRENARLIRRNVATLRYEDRSSVVFGDAYRFGKSVAVGDPEPCAVFLDPPYRDYETKGDKLVFLLESVIGNLSPGSLVVLEADRGLERIELPREEDWEVRRYGGTRVALLEIRGAEVEEPAELPE